MERTISSRSRNLGLGWTNRPVQTYNSRGQSAGLGFNAPRRPSAVGGPRAVEQELHDATKLNSGNDWTAAFFVAGEPVNAWTVGGGDEWWVLNRRDEIHMLLSFLREGIAVRVRTEEN